jgi:hypothetical protein
MKDLIEALTILLKYGDPFFPTHCEHGKLFVNINPDLVSNEDVSHLRVLGFSPGNDEFESSGFVSYLFGSC